MSAVPAGADPGAVAAARWVADRLAPDVADRDRSGHVPHPEIALVREAGLLGVDPTDHATTVAVTRVLAATDTSVAHLLGYHYLHLWRAGLYDDAELAARLRREAVEEGCFVAGVTDPAGEVTARPATGGGCTVSGRAAFATGAPVADRLLVGAGRDGDGARLVLVVRGDAAGLTFTDDWDTLGQRLTASGGVGFDDVVVGGDAVLGVIPADEGETSPRWNRLSLNALAFQSMLAQLLTGAADGALAEAARYTRTRSRPWATSGVTRAVDDPYVLAGYGHLAASLRLARLAADDALRALVDADAAGAGLTATERGEAALAVSVAKVECTRIALEVTGRVFELTGARATARERGLDRFWRDVRTLTLHDPVAYKARELGARLLRDEYPTVSATS